MRLFRGVSRGTHTSSESPDRAQEGAFSRRRRTYIRVYPLPLESPVRGVSASIRSAHALRSDGSSASRHRKSPRIAVELAQG